MSTRKQKWKIKSPEIFWEKKEKVNYLGMIARPVKNERIKVKVTN